jgi:hypothetical protein
VRVCVQWTRANPSDWDEVDSRDWSAEPSKAEPVGGESIDDAAGWPFRLCVQGVQFTADHYAVEHVDDETIRVHVWNDDPDDYPIGERYARVRTFRTLAPDARFRGAINTRQSQLIYADADVAARMVYMGTDPASIRPFEDYIKPDEAITRHGIWTSQESNDAHESARSVPTWRQWTEGLDASELDEFGEVKQQRSQDRYLKPFGTRTYYHSTTTLANGIHAATHENELAIATAAAGTQASNNIGGGADVLVWAGTTPTGEPDSAAWPTGDYRAQLDVTAIGGDVTIGLLTIGGSAGHFARVNTGLTSDLETKTQQESAFSGTGLHLATTGSVSWTAGAASDRFEILIAAGRPASHGNQTVTLELNEADDFCDGPWPAGGVTEDLDATIAAASTVSGALDVLKTISATVAGLSAVSGSLDVTKPIAVTVAGQSAITAALDALRGLSATIAGQATVAADLDVLRGLSAAVAGLSAVSGSLDVTKPIAVTVAGQSASPARSRDSPRSRQRSTYCER